MLCCRPKSLVCFCQKYNKAIVVKSINFFVSRMSSVLYDVQWKKAVSQLEEINLNYEPDAEAKPILDHKEAMEKLVALFVRYAQVKITANNA